MGKVKNLRNDVKLELINWLFENVYFKFYKRPITHTDGFLESDVRDLFSSLPDIDDKLRFASIILKTCRGDFSEFDMEYYGHPVDNNNGVVVISPPDYYINDCYNKLLAEYNMEFLLKEKSPVDYFLNSVEDKCCGKQDPCCKEGVKETEDKLSYELDWDFVKALAERMSRNKGKYPRDNWKKPININDIKDALTRHFIEIVMCNYADDGEEYGHLEAIAINAMILRYQLKNNK